MTINGKEYPLVPLTKEQARKHIGEEVYAWNSYEPELYTLDYIRNGKCVLLPFGVLDQNDEEKLFENIALPPDILKGTKQECERYIKDYKKKETRLTVYELSQLLKCFGVDCTWGSKTSYYNDVVPSAELENDEIIDDYKIRYKQGEWKPATRETVWEWWGEETPDSDIARFVTFFGWNKEN